MSISRFYKIGLLFSATAGLVLTGCATQNRSDQKLAPICTTINEIVIIEPDTDSSHVYEEQLERENIDHLLDEALKAGQEENFSKADTILRNAVKLVETSREYAELSWFPVENYLNRIVEIYSNYMPEDYVIPDEISALVFQQRLLDALGTLEVKPEDSVLLYRLSRERNNYDIPVVWNDRVQHSLLFFMRSRRGIFDRWLHRAGYYLPVKKQMFADAGLPQDLAYLPILESGYNPHAYSRAHASGIWQFIPSTGRAYGLRQNYWIDERRDPLKSADAAIRYLSKLYNDFGDWYLALAAYNCGEGRLGRTIRRDGTNDYWELSLPRETMNYVPLYLASMIIAKNPDIFDFSFSEDFRFNLDTVYVHDCIQLSTIANGLDISLDTLRRINPHLLQFSTPPDLSDVLLYLPNGYGNKFREFYANLPEEERVRWYRYRVRRGDNLIQIARNFGVTVEGIRAVNNIRGNTIIAGNHLYIPLPLNVKTPNQKTSRSGSAPSSQPRGQRVTYTVRQGDVVGRIARQFNVTVEEICRWNNLSRPEDLRAGQVISIYRQESRATTQNRPQNGNLGQYTVKSGDSPYSIAKELGISVNQLLRANNFSSGNPRIFPGDVLFYPLHSQTSEQSSPENTPSTESPNQRVIEYRVVQGDSLSRIAQLFSVSIKTIKELNGLTESSILRVGDRIKIPKNGNNS
ncbi:Membrane-bound lytic murein transglycosylase D precursor [Chitinispirillum alkaliphilum]|nr:Membrane-bound lytic murein transglycosylase D precursor [Chitinispirillum alkaliphilum]